MKAKSSGENVIHNTIFIEEELSKMGYFNDTAAILEGGKYTKL